MTPEILSAFLGLFMPALIEFIKKFTINKRWLNYTITLLVSIVIGIGTLSVKGTLGSFDINNVLTTTASALIASQAVYNYWFKNSKLAKRISNGK